jgi:hypothetical protein
VQGHEVHGKEINKANAVALGWKCKRGENKRSSKERGGKKFVLVCRLGQ